MTRPYNGTAVLDDDLWAQIGPYVITALGGDGDESSSAISARTFAETMIRVYAMNATWVEAAQWHTCEPEALAGRMRRLQRHQLWDLIAAILSARWPKVWWSEPRRGKRKSREWAFKGLEGEV
ncbi:hypothetical protein [Paracraurococcus lichenis]|uniref:Transposase n=1 Tax=Paracraurococcus lichenis TaxID=3064888 RepID=A0ABT9EB74_9PROT|nr:hypothetical protein [Paracraurococcus sp. LOR1-02]MDO9713451.1 hypothetical protein [Paracraurococcus sp. LOR1-02]